MNIRVFRKALGLIVLDIVIIIGIFVLQFRTDSNIIEKFGNLQITLEQTENQQNGVALKNTFLATYKGVSLSCDEKNPVQIMESRSGQKKAVQLVNWERVSELACKLIFTDDVSLIISVSSDSPKATLNTVAVLPSGISNMYVPYNFAYNMKIMKNDGNRVVLSDKKSSWEMTAVSLDDGYVSFNHKSLSASYASYDVTKKFSFDTITELAIAERSVFDETINNFKQNLISAYKANNSEASITEQVAVSYIAAKAEQGEYVQAIEEIPQSVKKSKQRTYLSAPYLNTLETMNEVLEAEMKERTKAITNSAASNSLDIFNARNLAPYLCIMQNDSIVTAVLENAAAAEASSVSVSQATGIIQTFIDLSTLNPVYAKILLPVLDGCIARITEACSFDGNVLTISENDTFLSVVQAVETGIAILRYGTITGNETLIKAGRVLINSYISESASFDLRTLANVYPIIAYNNTYYPHYEQLQTDDDKFVWAWTCAKSIFYEKDTEDNSITLNIDFPEGYTHYVIIKGISPFTSIYIYGMAFRTDPRFETYNSSGYVYKNDEKTLLLKSRHKSRFEVVRLEYDEAVARRRAEEAAAREEAERLAAEQAEAENAKSSETPGTEAPSQPAASTSAL